MYSFQRVYVCVCVTVMIKEEAMNVREWEAQEELKWGERQVKMMYSTHKILKEILKGI